MCGKPLSILRRLSGSEFCTPLHKAAFLREQEELGLARLLEWKPPSFKDESPPATERVISLPEDACRE